MRSSYLADVLAGFFFLIFLITLAWASAPRPAVPKAKCTIGRPPPGARF